MPVIVDTTGTVDQTDYFKQVDTVEAGGMWTYLAGFLWDKRPAHPRGGGQGGDLWLLQGQLGFLSDGERGGPSLWRRLRSRIWKEQTQKHKQEKKQEQEQEQEQ